MTAPCLLNLSSVYLPNRDELLFISVFALPNASCMRMNKCANHFTHKLNVRTRSGLTWMILFSSAAPSAPIKALSASIIIYGCFEPEWQRLMMWRMSSLVVSVLPDALSPLCDMDHEQIITCNVIISIENDLSGIENEVRT